MAYKALTKKLKIYALERQMAILKWIGQVEISIKTDTSEEVIQIEELEPAPAKLDDSLAPVQNPLEAVNLGDENWHRPIYISGLITGEFRERLRNLLREFKDCFAEEYDEMPGLSRDLVEHRLPIMEGYKPYKQPPRRMSTEIILKIKEEIERLLNAKFIRI